MDEESTDLHFDADLREEIEQAIFRRIDTAVKGASDRDQLLVEYDDQVEGLSNPTSPPRWQNACDLDAPITRQACLTLWTQLLQCVRRDPKVAVEAADPDDDDNASAQEALLSAKSDEIGLDRALSALAYYAIKYPVAVAYVDWVEKLKKESYPLYRRPKDKNGEFLEDYERNPGLDYRATWFKQTIVDYAGPEVRAVNTADFYLYPANARSINDAIGCGERMLMSADDLLLGVVQYGYDEEAVEELIQLGPQRRTASYDKRGTDDQRAGVTDMSEDGDQLFEIYLWYTRLPLLRDPDGQLKIQRDLLGEDVCCIGCPDASVMLRMSAYRKPRPYIPFWILPRYEMFYGDCAPQLLNALQTEANAHLRFQIDAANIAMSPAMKIRKTVANDNENFRFFPGAAFYVNAMDDMEPLLWQHPGNDSLAIQNYIEQAARELYSAGGYGVMPAKQRRSAEIQSVQLAAASKFDMILWHFQQGLEELCARIIVLYQENVEPEGMEFLDEENHRKKVTPQQLKGRYTYKAVGTTQTADPQVRLEHAMAKRQVTSEYNAMQLQGVPPPILKREWHAARQVLVDLGEHNPEAYLGPEPEEQPTMQGMATGNGQQATAMGMPGAPGQMQGGAPGGNAVANGAGLAAA